MKVKELIERLQQFDPESFVIEDGVHTFGQHYDSTEVLVTDGYFVTNDPGETFGNFVSRTMAHTKCPSKDNPRRKVTFLDFSSPNIRPAVKIHWQHWK